MAVTINGTTGIAGVDGSASTPAVQGTDTNTGIFFPAADTIAFGEGGAEVARFDSSGNLGIGVTPSTATIGKVVQLPSNSQIITNGDGYFTSNAIYNSGWKYVGTGEAASVAFNSGAVVFNNASSGTAGNSISFTERARITSAGLFQFDSGYGSVATAYGCRAWVNFNGTGTVAIRASGNVSSITDNNTGEYTVNFTNAMPDANYAVAGMGVASNGTAGSYGWLTALRGRTGGSCQTGSVSITNTNSAGSLTDADLLTVSVFR